MQLIAKAIVDPMGYAPKRLIKVEKACKAMKVTINAQPFKFRTCALGFFRQISQMYQEILLLQRLNSYRQESSI